MSSDSHLPHPGHHLEQALLALNQTRDARANADSKVQVDPHPLEVILDQPNQKLVIYGSLAPGEENHHVIAELQGTWQPCSVCGSIEITDHYPIFTWDPSGPVIQAQLFTSEQLPENWSFIDQFEGPAYRRHLVTVKTEAGILIANMYVGNEVR